MSVCQLTDNNSETVIYVLKSASTFTTNLRVREKRVDLEISCSCTLTVESHEPVASVFALQQRLVTEL